jgi:8-oxo-dGTP diphosphatase
MGKLNVVHAVVRNGDKFLLGKRSLTKQTGAGYWATIGGRVEPGESLESGIARECLEEIGIAVKPVRKVAVIEEQEATHHWFEVTVVSGDPFLACDENSELRWFTIDQIELLSPVTAEDLEVLLEI